MESNWRDIGSIKSRFLIGSPPDVCQPLSFQLSRQFVILPIEYSESEWMLIGPFELPSLKDLASLSNACFTA